jgi:uncharacterized protein YgiM (DUF1202 family)
MKRLLIGAGVLLAIVLLAQGIGLPFFVAQPAFADSVVTPVPVEGLYMSNLPDYGPAPELNNEVWLNTDQALPLATLSGKVVLLEMWTFSCYNCVNTLPYVRAWHDTYTEQGLVVIGNHYPEFDYESKIDNLREALVRLDIRYPVAQDNDRRTWDAYGNRYWPVMYLIDKRGHIRYYHIGEGAYDTTEANIQDLLWEDFTPPAEAAPISQSLSVTEDVNVHAAPDADQTTIGIIHPNEAYLIRGEQNGWYRINFGGQEGYISGEFVTLDQAAVS